MARRNPGSCALLVELNEKDRDLLIAQKCACGFTVSVSNREARSVFKELHKNCLLWRLVDPLVPRGNASRCCITILARGPDPWPNFELCDDVHGEEVQ